MKSHFFFFDPNKHVEPVDVPSPTIRRPILLVDATNLPTIFLGILIQAKPKCCQETAKKEQVGRFFKNK
jgi:hypothetical protein